MNKNKLTELGFERDKLLSGEETGKWKMPWGGAIEIEDRENIHDLLLKVYHIGRNIGIDEGEEIGTKKIQYKIKTLLGI